MAVNVGSLLCSLPNKNRLYAPSLGEAALTDKFSLEDWPVGVS